MYFSDSLTRTRHFHDQILAVVFSWPIVSSAKVGHGNETKCFGISRQFFHPNKNIFRFLNPNKKKIYFLDFLTQTKKKEYFQIPQPERGISMTKSWLLFSAGRLFHQLKVGHGNETKCFGIRNNSCIQTKIFFRSLDPNSKKKCFQIPQPERGISMTKSLLLFLA